MTNNRDKAQRLVRRDGFWYDAVMSDAASKPRWYRFTPDRFLIVLLAAVLLVWLADRFGLLGLARDSGWNVLLAIAIVCLGMLGGLIWLGVSLLLRRRFQFGLKSVLVLTVIVAILCSWFTVKKQQADRQEEAVKAIQELGGRVMYDHQLPRGQFPGQKRFLEDAVARVATYSRNLVGTDFLSYAVDVAFCGPQVTDAGLMHLEELTDLKMLILNGTQVTDAGLVHLNGLTNLIRLDLKDTQATDDGVEKLQQALPKCWIMR